MARLSVVEGKPVTMNPADLPMPVGAGRQPAVARVVDVSVLESLVGHDPEVVLEFLDAFQISASEIARELTAACHAHQAALTGRQAHKLRSSACNIGALALGGLCAEMEAAGNTGDMHALTVLLPLFAQEFDAVNAYLDFLQTQPAELRHDR